MSNVQLHDRDLIADALTKAGWKASSQQEKFEIGRWAYFEVEMSYTNGTMELTLRLDAQKSVIYFTLTSSSERTVTLHISCMKDLEQLLNAIIGLQDRITEENYRSEVAEIVKVCPETYVASDADEDTLVRLVVKTPNEKG